MLKIEDLDSLTWLEPYYEEVLGRNGGYEEITSLIPLQYDDGSQVKIKLYPQKSSVHPFIDFCKKPEISKIIMEKGILVIAKQALVIDIDVFIKCFRDKSAYVDLDYMQSTLKAINKRAKQWRNAGAKYVMFVSSTLENK